MIKRFFKKFKQKLAEYNKIEANKNVSDDEIWNLDYSMAQWLAPRLKRLAESSPLCPTDYLNNEEWRKDLLKNATILENYVPWESENTEEIDKAIEFIRENYHNFWF